MNSIFISHICTCRTKCAWRRTISTGVAQGGTRGPCPRPVDRRVKKTHTNKMIIKIIQKGKRVGNWSMPLHKLPLIMAFNVQENDVFIHEFQKSSYRGRGKTSIPHPPQARSLRSLALAPRWQIMAAPLSLA